MIACVVLSLMSLGILTSQISSARLVTEAREITTADRVLGSVMSQVLLEPVSNLCSNASPFPFDTPLFVEPTLLGDPDLRLATPNWSDGDAVPARLDLVLTLEWTNARGRRVELSLATSHR